MTPKQWKQLKSFTILRRIGTTEEHLIGIMGNGTVYSMRELSSTIGRHQELTGPEQWEVAITRREYIRRERAWLKEQEANARGDDEGDDEDDAC
jgi:hypothetical protein